jgi:membrane-bound serine protease (ClpP class)
MLKGSRAALGPLLLLSGVVLAGCAGVPSINDPTGIAFVDRFLAFLANPNVAYLLFVLGLLAVIAEFATPGAVAPGVTGVILLILSLYALLQLPTNWLGPVLIITGIVMLLLDIKVTGFALSIGGVIAFVLGSLLIFTPPWAPMPLSSASAARLNPWLIVALTVGVFLFFILGIAAAVRAQRRPVAVGRETLIGKTGTAYEALTPRGTVHVEGEVWTADSANGEAIPAGTQIRVVSVEGLRLRVERDWGAARWSERAPWPADSTDAARSEDATNPEDVR